MLELPRIIMWMLKNWFTRNKNTVFEFLLVINLQSIKHLNKNTRWLKFLTWLRCTVLLMLL